MSQGPLALAPRPLRALRYARLALHVFAGVLATLFLAPLLKDRGRWRLRRAWSRRLLAILGVELELRGEPVRTPALLVANHVSWLDIFVINAVAPAAFISKAEVRNWPVIGWLAARNETVFLRRGSRGHARVINAEVASLLGSGRNVAVFPEGTTTDGTHVLHFHAALLQPAIESRHPIQPLAVSYHEGSGERSIRAAYAGDTSFGQCLAAIVAAPRLVAHLQGGPVLTTLGTHRRELADAGRAFIDAVVSAPASADPGPAGHPSGGTLRTLDRDDSALPMRQKSA